MDEGHGHGHGHGYGGGNDGSMQETIVAESAVPGDSDQVYESLHFHLASSHAPVKIKQKSLAAGMKVLQVADVDHRESFREYARQLLPDDGFPQETLGTTELDDSDNSTDGTDAHDLHDWDPAGKPTPARLKALANLASLTPTLLHVLKSDMMMIVGGGAGNSGVALALPHLPHLPVDPPVDDLLTEFGQACLDMERLDSGHAVMLSNIRALFNARLQSHLLYDPEQVQEAQARLTGKLPSQMYGALHLLRLVCELPNIFVELQTSDFGTWCDADVAVLVHILQLLTRWLEGQAGRLFRFDAYGPTDAVMKNMRDRAELMNAMYM
jgi:hypothetical protein